MSKERLSDIFERIVEAAARVARQLHEGQVDKAGVDYFSGHLTAVAQMGETWQERVVGYLHDASEDTPHTVDEVLTMLDNELGEPLPPQMRSELARALFLLNHHNFENKKAYFEAIATDQLARAVKLNDLTHNMDLTRLPEVTEEDHKRMERYHFGYNFLQSQKTSR